MSEIIVLSGKKQLGFLSLLALSRFNNNESFCDEEVLGYFGAIEKVFGKGEASGFLNLVLETYKKYNGKMTFNMCVVETIVEHMRKEKEATT